MVHKTGLVLPTLVVGQPDIIRLRRELEALYEHLHQAALRKTSKAELKLPSTSHLLGEIAELNKLNLLKRDDYEWLHTQLTTLHKTAPQIHLAFSTDPSAAFLGKIVVWLRSNVHPQLLIQVGLQPNLAAGCVVRTPSRQFDLSLKQHFIAARPLLIKKLGEARA